MRNVRPTRNRSASPLDPDSVGGSIARLDERRWGGMQYLAHRLGEQQLSTGRRLPAAQVARILAAAAERTLCR